MADVHPHETVVSWIKFNLRRHPKYCFYNPGNEVHSWGEEPVIRQETPDHYFARLKKVTEMIDKCKNLKAICRALPKRADAIIESDGAKLKH